MISDSPAAKQAALKNAHRLRKQREELDAKIDAIMDPISRDLATRAMAIEASPTLTAELGRLRDEVATWPAGFHRSEGFTLINMIEREA